MMKRLLPSIAVFSILSVFSGCTVEENIEPSDTSGFVKLIGENSNSPTTAVDMKYHPDGGYLLLANVEEVEDGASKFRPKLLRVDDRGIIQWSLVSTTDEIGDFRSTSLTVLGNNSFIISGYEVVDSENYAAVCLATGSDFKFLRFGNQSGAIKGILRGAIKESDGNDLVGIVEQPDQADKHSLLIEFASSAPGTVPEDDNVADIIKDKIEFERQVSSDSNPDEKAPILNTLQMDNSGKVIWGGPRDLKSELSTAQRGSDIEQSPLYPYQESTEFKMTDFHVTNTGANRYYMIGTITDEDQTNIRLVITDNLSAQPILQNVEYDYEGTDTPNSITVSAFGDILILATSDRGVIGDEDFMLLKVDVDGNITFPGGEPKYYGGAGTETAAAVLPSEDNGILMFGHTEFADVNTLLLIKVMENGEFEKK